jgi:hypothetical protein
VQPRFDTAFLGYLAFAIQEEEAVSARQGGVPTVWMQVLHIVKQGVLEEFERRYDRLLEPLVLHVRFEDADLRSDLFRRFVDMVPPLELRYMRELAMNMASSIQDQAAAGEVFPDAQLALKMQQLESDIETFLSEEIIDSKVAAFIAKAGRQGTEVRCLIAHGGGGDLASDLTDCPSLLFDPSFKHPHTHTGGHTHEEPCDAR